MYLRRKINLINEMSQNLFSYFHTLKIRIKKLKVKDFSNNCSLTSVKFPMKTLAKDKRLVFTLKYELEYGDESKQTASFGPFAFPEI